MSRSTLLFVATVVALGFASAAPVADAQDWDPEAGDTGQWEPPPQQQGQWFNQDQERPPAMGGEQPGGEGPAGDSDHAQMVGNAGFTFFGVERLQIGVTATDTAATLRAPTVGIRYWVSEGLGLDLGLGLSFASLSSEETELDAGVPTSFVIDGSLDGTFGIGLHVGLPVALSHARHYAILFIPELDFGYGKATFISRTAAEYDLDLTGLNINVGARLGAEIHFGFWNVPNLSLQASIGLNIRYVSGEVKNLAEFGAGGIAESETDFSIGTTVNDIFNGNIRATYYF